MRFSYGQGIVVDPPAVGATSTFASQHSQWRINPGREKAEEEEVKNLEKCLTGGHFGQTQDDEELTGHDPTIAPEHAGHATIYQQLEIIEEDKFRSVEVRTAPSGRGIWETYQVGEL